MLGSMPSLAHTIHQNNVKRDDVCECGGKVGEHEKVGDDDDDVVGGGSRGEKMSRSRPEIRGRMGGGGRKFGRNGSRGSQLVGQCTRWCSHLGLGGACSEESVPHQDGEVTSTTGNCKARLTPFSVQLCRSCARQ